MPEAFIEPHNVLSPLPKRLQPQKLLNVIEKGTKKSEPAVQKIKDNMKVFAKWVERTDVKFWPGIIKQEEAEQDDKHLIVFEDGLEKTVKKEDIIRADALVPGKYALCFLTILIANFSENLVAIASIFPLPIALLCQSIGGHK